MSFCNLMIFKLSESILSKLIFLFGVEIFWLFSKMQLHSGTIVPIYTPCLHTVLNVLSYVAFTLLVQNYLCTILPIIYTVVHNSLHTSF
jgi:hypothetical protein